MMTVIIVDVDNAEDWPFEADDQSGTIEIIIPS